MILLLLTQNVGIKMWQLLRKCIFWCFASFSEFWRKKVLFLRPGFGQTGQKIGFYVVWCSYVHGCSDLITFGQYYDYLGPFSLVPGYHIPRPGSVLKWVKFQPFHVICRHSAGFIPTASWWPFWWPSFQNVPRHFYVLMI